MCHEVAPAAAGDAPTIWGYGSTSWVARVISDPSQPDLYGKSAEMPAFAGELSPDQIMALARLLVDDEKETE
jgi:mono/diheme cytochrome c family protein